MATAAHTTPNPPRPAALLELVELSRQAKNAPASLVASLQIKALACIVNLAPNPTTGLQASSCNAPPSHNTPMLPDRLATPTFTNYHLIGPCPITIQLDLPPLTLLPKEIQELLTGIEVERITCYAVVVDGRCLEGPQLNVSLHGWLHENTLPGDHTIQTIPAGIFPLIGIYEGSQDPITHNRLGPLEVHTHPGVRENDQSPVENCTLFSPNNAHFRVFPNSPVLACWVLAEDGKGRYCLTKLTSLNTKTKNPIAERLWHAGRDCRTLQEHVDKLEKLPQVFDEYFEQTRFQDLHPSFQDGIYRATWKLRRCPMGNPHFGKEYFGAHPEIQREATKHFCETLKEDLITSHIALLTQGQRLPKGDNVDRVMECALQCLQGGRLGPFFHELGPQARHATEHALWQLSGCPSTGKPIPFEKAELIKQTDALLIAATRLPYEDPASLIQMIDDPLFRTLPGKQRSLAFNQRLQEMLDKNSLTSFYYTIYKESKASPKGGNRWGELHVADDLELLRTTVQFLLLIH